MFVNVMDFTHAYIAGMGSALAPEKSKLMTNDIAAAKPRAAGIAALEEAKKALKVSQAVVADLEAQLEAVRKAAVRGTPSTC